MTARLADTVGESGKSVPRLRCETGSPGLPGNRKPCRDRRQSQAAMLGRAKTTNTLNFLSLSNGGLTRKVTLKSLRTFGNKDIKYFGRMYYEHKETQSIATQKMAGSFSRADFSREGKFGCERA